MPEYTYPGVYVEEIDTGNKPIEGVSTSTVGFLGLAERGPLDTRLITSFGDFVRLYGRYTKVDGNDAYLAYAVEGFFQNGGKRCVIARVASAGATLQSVAAGGWRITALGPGAWSNRLYYSIVQKPDANQPPVGPPLFTLTLIYFNTDNPDLPTADRPGVNPRQVQHLEVFEDLVVDEASSNFVERRVNWVSTLVMVNQTGATPPVPVDTLTQFGPGDPGGAVTPNDYKGDETQPPGMKSGLAALAEYDDISLLCCPDEHRFYPAIANLLKTQAERLRYRFAILQSEENPGALPNINPSGAGSKYAAFYYPWLNIVDGTSGKLIRIPPGGHVAGIYARTDTERGVHKAPANAAINGIDSLIAELNNEQQGVLNPKGINVLRYFRGMGNLVWGARTVASDPDWKYINVRRLFIFVEKSLERGTQWVVFESNDEHTWARVRRSVGDFLTRLWMDGMLQGATRQEAYFVKCDRTTMTQADIDNGRLICVIGIAPVKPAEFVIFRIGQWTGGSEVTEQ